MRTHSYSPSWVMNAVSHRSFAVTGICFCRVYVSGISSCPVHPVFFSLNKSVQFSSVLRVADVGVERGNDLRRSDLGQRLVDRRHGVRIAHCETVQVPIVTGNAHTSGFLGDADNGARHRTYRRAYESHV